MNEELRNELAKMRNDFADLLKQKSSMDEQKFNEERNALQDKIAELQKRLDDAVVKFGRPMGGADNRAQYKAQVAKLLRSQFNNITVRAEAADPAETTTNGNSYNIHPMFMQEIIRQEDAVTFVRRLFDWQTATTPDIRQPLSSGLTVGHVGEGDERVTTGVITFKETKPTWSQIYALPELTRELVQDSSYDIESWYVAEIGRAFGLQTEQDVLTGAGTGNACKGFFVMDMDTAADGTRDVTKFQKIETAVASKVDFDDLKKMVSALRLSYRSGASWLMNHDLYLALQLLKDNQGRYLMQPAVTQGEPDRLLGYPVYDSEFVPAAADEKIPLAFGNYKRAACGFDRPQIGIMRDEITHKGFVSFYTEKRLGFMPKDTAAVKFLVVKKATA